MVGLSEMIITSRPQSTTVPMIPSTHQLGDIVHFNPLVLRQSPLLGTVITVKARVERISFDFGKVLYDLAISDDSGGFYDAYPICNVDSIFVS